MPNDTPSTDATRPREYVVIARRYRPRQFDDLIGQGHVAKALSNAISTNRVGHAYLFTGARGVGKTSAARILAKALNCEQGPTATPCDECDICQSIASGDDVDVLEIDGASNRGIDEIRQLRQNVNVRPSRARYKIYIIDEVHMLTKEAFNALLKTLEEPPEHVKFIFATTEPNKIPVTILSRCQRFDFAGVDAAAIRTRLAQIAQAEGIDAEPAALEILARRAEGSMRDSQSLLEQLLSTGQHKLTAADVNSLLGTASSERLVALVDHLAHRDAAAALLELDAVVAEGVDPGQLAEQLLGYFRDMMAAAVGCGRQQFRYAGPDDAAAISAAGERFGLETILAAIQILEQTLSRMRLSVHARTIAEAAVVRLCRLDDLDSLPALVAELRGGGPSAGRSPGAPGVPARGASVGPRTSNGPSSASSQQSTPPRDRAPRDRSAARHEQSTQPPRGSAAAGGEQSSSTGVLVAEASAERIAISPQTARRAWEAALAWLDEQSELVAVHAAKFDSMDYRPPEEDAPGGAGRMVVRFASTYTSCREFCQQPVQKAKLEEALTLVAGSPVLLEFAVSDAAAAQPAPQARALTRRQLEAEVVGRPFVQRAMELFDTTKIRVDPPTAS